jgi:hypothetical protein
MDEPVTTPIKPPSWKAILALLGWASPFLIGAGMLYLGREFATHTEVRAAVAPFEQLPAQVQSLSEFRSRQERAQEKSEAKFETVQQSLATISAQQRATDEKLNRVLDTLEDMNRRTRVP